MEHGAIQPESDVYVCCMTLGLLEIRQKPRKDWLAVLASAMLSCPVRQLLIPFHRKAALRSADEQTSAKYEYRADSGL